MIEDKVSEDPGTARDKIARVGQLRSHENARPAGQPRCQVVSVIDGRGFRERGPDLGNLMTACDGHVYTPELLHELVQPGGLLEPFIGTV